MAPDKREETLDKSKIPFLGWAISNLHNGKKGPKRKVDLSYLQEV